MGVTIKMQVVDRGFKKLRRQLIEAVATEPHVKVGVLASKGGAERHPDSTLSMVEIAAVHEFGSPAARIPERSFIRSTFEKNTSGLERMMKRLARGVVTGKLPLRAGLEALGQWGVAQVQKTMSAGVPPPLAASTLRARRRIQRGKSGRDVPLINSGRLRQSISYEVEA